MKLLVVGASGMLGREVVAAATAAGHTVTERDVDSIDIVDAEFTNDVVAGDAPDAVVNCAAFTDVDGAEDQEDVALEVNGVGAGNLAYAAAADFSVRNANGTACCRSRPTHLSRHPAGNAHAPDGASSQC